jgi:hypothetical protein
MNKKAIQLILAGVLALVLMAPAMGQGNDGKDTKKKDFRFTLKTNPLNALGGPFWVIVVPITGEYKLLGEAALSKKVSFQAGVSYIGPSVLLNLNNLKTDTASGFSGIKVSGFKVSGMVKIFLSRDLPAPQGFYVGPHFSYASAKLSSKDNTSDYIGATKLCINAVVGYQLITSGGFTLDIFTGMGYVKREWSFNGSSQGELDLGSNRTGINIPLGVSFGYAF